MKAHHHAKGLGMASDTSRRRMIDALRSKDIRDERVLAAMAKVPRHEFLEEAFQSRAYENNALVIGHAQTISQPYIVALMTEAILNDGVPKRVLEIGTGSGYQCAVLAELVPAVFTVERLRALSAVARRRLAALGYQNIFFNYGDGGLGWPSHAPYDAIVVTAAARRVPPALVEQLAPGARMVIPVGGDKDQSLRLVQRTASGVTDRRLADVSFVPLLEGRA